MFGSYMLFLVLLALLVVGAGLVRLRPAHPPRGYYSAVTDNAENMAVLIAAHDHEDRIVGALNSAARVVPVSNIHLVSDDSGDRTAELARDYGVRVVETFGPQGPAGAVESGIQAFRLLDEYPFVLVSDVDTRLEPQHLERVLPVFDDESVAAVDVLVDADWRAYRRGPVAAVLTAYRARSYALAGRILPSPARTYRSSSYGTDAGRVAVCRQVVARTAVPIRLSDYRAQNRLWHNEFWQSTQREGRRRIGTVAELLGSSLLFALAPLVVLVLAFLLPLTAVAIAATIVGADYLLTVAVAVARRQPRYLLPGLLFPVLRVLDAVSVLAALIRRRPEEPSREWLTFGADPRPADPPARVDPPAKRRNPLLAAVAWVLCAGVAAVAVVRVALTTATLPPSPAENALVEAAYGTGPALGGTLRFTDLQLRAYTTVTSAFGRHASVLQAARELSVVTTVVIMLGVLAVAAILRVHPLVTVLAVGLLAVSGPAIALLAPVLPGVPAAAWLAVAIVGTVAAIGWRDHRWLTGAAAALLAALVTAPILLVPIGAGLAAWLAGRSGIASLGTLAVTGGAAIGLWRADVLLLPGESPLEPRQRLLLLGVAGAAAAGGLIVRWLRPMAAGIGAGVVLTAAVGPAADTLLPALVLASVLLVAVMIEETIGAQPEGGPTLPARAATALATAAAVSGAAAGVALTPRSWTPLDHAGLAAWVVQNLDRDVRLVAPPGLRADLERDLARTGRSNTAQAPHELRVAVGPNRPSGIQLATFGTVAVLLTEPGERYFELGTRLGPGMQLALNPRLRADPEVRAAIRDGRVDLRAMALLAAMCREHAITVAQTGNPAHETGSPQPDRTLVLSEVDGQPVIDETRAAPLLAWLRAQEPPYAPADISVTPAGVRISWRLPVRLDLPPS